MHKSRVDSIDEKSYNKNQRRKRRDWKRRSSRSGTCEFTAFYSFYLAHMKEKKRWDCVSMASYGGNQVQLVKRTHWNPTNRVLFFVRWRWMSGILRSIEFEFAPSIANQNFADREISDFPCSRIHKINFCWIQCVYAVGQGLRPTLWWGMWVCVNECECYKEIPRQQRNERGEMCEIINDECGSVRAALSTTHIIITYYY